MVSVFSAVDLRLTVSNYKTNCVVSVFGALDLTVSNYKTNCLVSVFGARSRSH